jgi:hypothetical protein
MRRFACCIFLAHIKKALVNGKHEQQPTTEAFSSLQNNLLKHHLGGGQFAPEWGGQFRPTTWSVCPDLPGQIRPVSPVDSSMTRRIIDSLFQEPCQIRSESPCLVGSPKL